MEHAQRGRRTQTCTSCVLCVLILILMEHAQREYKDSVVYDLESVLILILMEHAQRALIEPLLAVQSRMS